jgi:hypothetical protein
MTLGPAQVHAQEHLRPVGRFRTTGAGADRQERRTLVVLAREEEGGPLTREVRVERREVAFELGLEFGVGGLVEQFDRGEQVVGAGQELLPRRDLAAQAVGFAQDLLRGSPVVPEAFPLGLCLYLGDACFFRRKVKDAPRSTGSVQPGRGWRMLPPSSGPADPGAGSGAAR